MPAGTFERLIAGLGAVGALAAPATAQAEAQAWRFHMDHVLGTSFDMAVVARTEAQAQFAFAAALAEIRRLDAVLSAWRDDSELSGLNRAAGGVVSADLFRVIAACESWRARTDGAFCARLGAVEAVWRAAEAPPEAAELQPLAQAAAAATVRLVPAERRIERPGEVVFAPDGLAKGYVIDSAINAARRAAPVGGLMIDIGGDVRCWGSGLVGEPWRVGVAGPGGLHDNAAPATVLQVSNRAVAASGPGPRDRRIAGRDHCHLLDPATGLAAQARHAVAVADHAADADAVATALSVMAPEAGLALAERLPNVEALIFADGRRLATSGWSRLEAADAPAACAAGPVLPGDFAVEVGYELPRIAAANYRKPYVVVWVTDAEKNHVRTLLVMGAEAKWMEDNYVWWRRVGRKEPAAMATAKPTRAPGKYSVAWDGKDAAGRPVGQGRYTIHIEAAREHGGHAYQTVEVDLGASPVQAVAAAKDELGAASVRYGRRK